MALKNTDVTAIIPAQPRLSRLQWVLLAVVLLVGLGVRLVNLTNPPLDFHAWRQLRSAVLAREYYQAGVAGDQAVEAYDLMEPPIMERLTALTYRLIGREWLPVARVYAILFWMLGGAALFDLGRRATSFYGGLAALGAYLFIPFGIIASRSFQPDPLMTAGIAAGAWALYRWSETPGWKWSLIAGALAGFAVLVKIFAVFPLALVAVLLALHSWGFRGSLKKPQVWVTAAIMTAIPFVYYILIVRGGGEYIAGWSLNFANLLTDYSFYFTWLRTLKELVGLELICLSLVGALLMPARGRWVALGLWGGYALFSLVVPSLIITHNYYNLMLMPITGLGLAGAAAALADRLAKQTLFWRLAAAAVIALFVALPVWNARVDLVQVDYRPEVRGWQRMGAQLPKGRYIGLTHDYNTRLMYYGNIQVSHWPYYADMEMNILSGGNEDVNSPAWVGRFDRDTAGYDYFIVTLLDELEKQPVLKQTLYDRYAYTEGEGYILIDLHSRKP